MNPSEVLTLVFLAALVSGGVSYFTGRAHALKSILRGDLRLKGESYCPGCGTWLNPPRVSRLCPTCRPELAPSSWETFRGFLRLMRGRHG